jgi:hypothetical protein
MTGIAFSRQQQPLSSLTLPFPKEAFSPATLNFAKEIAERLQDRSSAGSLLKESVAGMAQTRVERVSDAPSLDERLFNALAAVKIMTSQVAMHLDTQWRQKLFAQLDSLHDPVEWEQGDEPLQQQSFATFLKAILAINPERRPGLGLSSAGHLIAAWTTGPDRLTIEFLPDDRILWVLACTVAGETDRIAGDTSVSRLIERLAPYRPEHWFRHAAQQDHQPA